MEKGKEQKTHQRTLGSLLTMNSQPLAQQANKHLRETQNQFQGQ